MFHFEEPLKLDLFGHGRELILCVLGRVQGSPSSHVLMYFRCGNPLAGNPSITQARHRHHLMLCSQSLEKFLSMYYRRKLLRKVWNEKGHFSDQDRKIGSSQIVTG